MDALNPQGIGLGLYLSKKLSKRLGGKIEVYSDARTGTTMTFSVSAKMEKDSSVYGGEMNIENAKISLVFKTDDIEEQKGIIQLPSITTQAMPRRTTYGNLPCDCVKVLVVDDEPLNTYVLQAYLKSVNVVSDIAINGAEALEKVKNKKCPKCHSGYTVILMDINMPIMDGIECTRAIQKLIDNDEVPYVSIFAVTAAAHLENSQVFAQYQTIGFTAIRNFCSCFVLITTLNSPEACIKARSIKCFEHILIKAVHLYY